MRSDPLAFVDCRGGTYDSIAHGAGLAVMTAEYNYLRKKRRLRNRLATLAGEYFRRERLGVTFYYVGRIGDTFPD